MYASKTRKVFSPGENCHFNFRAKIRICFLNVLQLHTILVELLTFIDFCVFLGVLAFG